MARELLFDEGSSRSLETDIFSFGCVAFHIITGDLPFKNTLDEHQLVIDRYKGAYPVSEDVSYPDLDAGAVVMDVMRSCWSTDPAERPVIGNIVQSLKKGRVGYLGPAIIVQ